MASLKRSKTMPADGQTAKFLYTILKQLDLKSIDWNLVASQLDITNGHAARMRFSRFRQHMEGIPTNPRGPRQPKKQKTEKAAAQSKKQLLEEEKQKPEIDTPPVKKEPEPEPEPIIKSELPVDPLLTSNNSLASSGLYIPSSYPVPTVAPADLTLHCPPPPQPIGYAAPPIGENMVPVKAEQIENGRPLQEHFVKMEPHLGI